MNPLLPIDETTMSVLITHFSRSAVAVTALMGLLFTARAVFLLLSVSGSSAYAELVKDTVEYFVLIALFPMLFKLCVTVTGSLAYSLQYHPPRYKESDDLLSGFLLSFNPAFGPLSLIIEFVATHTARIISTFLTALLVAIGPVVILLNTMFDFNGGNRLYFTALLSLCLWPVFWNLLGLLATELVDTVAVTSLSNLLYWFLISLTQIVSPLIAIALFSSLSPGKSISSAASKIQSASSYVTSLKAKEGARARASKKQTLPS